MKLSARRTGNGLYSIAAGVVLLLFSTHVAAQTPAVTSAVPTLINFSGTLSDTNGKPLTDVTGVTFLLYKDSEGYRKPIPTLSNRTSLKGARLLYRARALRRAQGTRHPVAAPTRSEEAANPGMKQEKTQRSLQFVIRPPRKRSR